MTAPVPSTPRQGECDSRASDSTLAMFQNLGCTRASAPGLEAWGHLEHLVKIGQGFFGDVYRAWDARLQREVALKVWRWAAHPQEGGRLGLREARALARIRHPNVVTVYGVDQHEGRIGIWMEYIRGRTLDALLRDHGPLAAREAALVGLDLCSALSAVHGLGLLHRDIKAKNVMREEGGRIVLMDFGLSLDLRDRNPGALELEMCGTPQYMSPELLRGEKASVQSDIYALGVLLYHLVTRCFPVEGSNLNEVHEAHQRGEATLLRDRRAGLLESFLATIERSLSTESVKRFTSVGHMAQSLSTSLVFGVSALHK
jgi:serine/threonine protein kinase